MRLPSSTSHRCIRIEPADADPDFLARDAALRTPPRAVDSYTRMATRSRHGASRAALGAAAVLSALPRVAASSSNYNCWETFNTVVGKIAYMVQQCQQTCCDSNDLHDRMLGCANGTLPQARGSAEILLGARGSVEDNHYARLHANVSNPTDPFQKCMLGFVANPIDNGAARLTLHAAVAVGCAITVFCALR